MKAIRSELSEHQYRMALVAYSMRAKIVNLPDEFVAWLAGVTDGYRGAEFSPTIMEMLSMLAKVPRATREAALNTLNDPTKASR